MQFDYFSKAGMPVVKVEFKNNLSAKVWYVLFDVFERLGGKQLGDNIDNWEFPSHITAEVLHTAIHNTCFVCGGLMKEGTAIHQASGYVSTEFRGALAKIEYKNMGEPRIVQGRKCSICGHFHI